MAQIFEMIMLICFGVSWPISVIKSIRARSAKGKSLIFTIAIITGYICGILGKILSHNVTYVLGFYILNLTMVTIDLVVSIRNRRLDRAAEREAKTA